MCPTAWGKLLLFAACVGAAGQPTPSPTANSLFPLETLVVDGGRVAPRGRESGAWTRGLVDRSSPMDAPAAYSLSLAFRFSFLGQEYSNLTLLSTGHVVFGVVNASNCLYEQSTLSAASPAYPGLVVVGVDAGASWLYYRTDNRSYVALSYGGYFLNVSTGACDPAQPLYFELLIARAGGDAGRTLMEVHPGLRCTPARGAYMGSLLVWHPSGLYGGFCG
jgi:hypothetical protein